jgi:integrase
VGGKNEYYFFIRTPVCIKRRTKVELNKDELPKGDGEPYSLFLYGMNSPKTKEKCVGRLRMFFNDLHLPGESMEERCNLFCEQAKQDNSWVSRGVISYLQKQKVRVENKEIKAGTLKNHYQAIKLFCEMNDIVISWKKISKGLPKVRKYGDDRSPTPEEIRRIIDYPDRRIKPIAFSMASSAIRVGAWDYLQWKHITPKEKDGEVVAGRLVVYGGEPEEYFTFITPEAYFELQKWKEYRKQSGEQLTENSWVMRQTWNTKKGYSRGLVTSPKKLKSEGVKRLVEDALTNAGFLSSNRPSDK